MKLLICGSRHFNDYELFRRVLDKLASELGTISEVIEGGARGCDRLGRRWAEENKIPVRTFNADWNRFGKAAGILRNVQMLKEGKPDFVVGFHRSDSRGTKDMLNRAEEANIRTYRVKISD